MLHLKRKVLWVTGDFSVTVKVFHSFGSKAFLTPTKDPAVVLRCSSLAAWAAPAGAVVVEVGYKLVSCKTRAAAVNTPNVNIDFSYTCLAS